MLLYIGATDYKCSFDDDLVEYVENTYTTAPIICSDEFNKFATLVASNSSILCPPHTVTDAMELLIVLLREMMLLM